MEGTFTKAKLLKKMEEEQIPVEMQNFVEHLGKEGKYVFYFKQGEDEADFSLRLSWLKE